MSSKGYQAVSSTSPSTSMKAQEGVNEMPREEGSEEDPPLPPQQGFAIIEQMGSDDNEDEGISSDEGEGFVQNGGYQLLAQEPEGPDINNDDNDQEWESSPTTGGTSAGLTAAAAIPAALPYDPAEMQQYAAGGISQPTSSSTNPNLPQHLANLMPAQSSRPDQTAKVSYSDTKDTRELRMKTMAADDKIKAAMAGLKLPGMATPQWANFVSEDDWKKNLGARLDSMVKQDTKQSGGGKDGSLEKWGER